MRFKGTQGSKLKAILLLSAIYYLLSTFLCGCEAFRRKFVRKPKKEKEIEVVIRTQEYESQYSIEQTYKKYFLFWRAAHDELINLLNIQDGSRKRRLSLAKRIIENLQQLRQLLVPEKQKHLDSYISEQKIIAQQLDEHKLHLSKRARIKNKLERQRRGLLREFSSRHIQEYLIKE